MKINKWYSNLRIRDKLLLIFSVNFIFCIAISAFSAACMLKVKTIAFTESNPVAGLDGIFNSFLSAALILFLIFSLLLIYLTFITIKSIVLPIEMLSNATGLIAKGEIDGSVASNRQDEIGQLARDIDKVLSVLRNLCDDIKSFSDRHNIAGDVYAKINAEKYDGDIKTAVELLNMTISQYISDARDILYCISEFTNGNFNTQLRSFPGTKAVATNISDGLRKELMLLTKEMGAAVSMAAAGNFELSLSETGFKGEWGTLAREINVLIENVAASIRETTDAMLEIYDGNLNPLIKGSFTGDFALIKTSASNAVENISGNIREISDALTELSNGNPIEIDGEFPGDYAIAGAALNKIAHSMTSALGEADASAEAIDTYAKQLKHIFEAVPQFDSSTKRMNDQADKLFSPYSDDNALTDGMSKIIELMEDISHQASLLALTASVEVARAGAHGKGFALVTEEINNIAERNNQAIVEVEEILNTSNERIKTREADLKQAVNEIIQDASANERLPEYFGLIKEATNVPDEISLLAGKLKRGSFADSEKKI